MEPIPVAAFQIFDSKFFKDQYPNQRYGQAFCNQFQLANDNELFYCENVKECQKIIGDKYLSSQATPAAGQNKEN